MPDLSNRIALVTGATRGVGRGVALDLAGAGATVYLTGRSVDPGKTTDALPGTVDEAAAVCRERGGNAIGVRCDHTNDAQVAALFERIRADQGRLDILVNNVWGGYEDPKCRPLSPAPFWEADIEEYDRMHAAGVRAHLVASRHAVPLLLDRPDNAPPGLIVTTIAWLGSDEVYAGNLHYDVAKQVARRLAWAMAQELRAHRAASIALAPGFTATERVQAAFERNPNMAKEAGGFRPTETPAYTGRAVCALAGDAEILERTGQTYEVGALARIYGFTDADGTRPAPFSEILAQMRNDAF